MTAKKYICIEDATSIEEQCAQESIVDYNMPLRVGALFIILVTSALGKVTPDLFYYYLIKCHIKYHSWD